MKNRGAIGANLTAARKRAGLSQEELAVKLNVTRQTVSNWEGGKSQPDIEMLKRLASALSVPVERLIYGEDLPGRRPAQRQNPIGRLCRWLAWSVYLLGGWAGFRLIRYNYSLYYTEIRSSLPVWAAALIVGTVLLALSEIIRLLEKSFP